MFANDGGILVFHHIQSLIIMMLVVHKEFRLYTLLLTILLDDLFQELLIPLKIPASLSQNESTFGYISVGSHTIIAQRKKQKAVEELLVILQNGGMK